MKLFRITYEGVYLGGLAVVYAENAERALELLRQDPKSFGAKSPEVKELPLEAEAILHNDDGDY